MIATVRTETYDWHVRREGPENAPPLLLLHGFTGCAAFWDEVIDALMPAFRITAVDLPGHGQTRALSRDRACAMDAVAAGLAELLVRVGTPRTHLWGYSMGGRLALFFAVRYPDHVHRLILESVSPGIADPEARRQRREEDDARADAIESAGVNAFVQEWIAQPLFATQTGMPETKRRRALKLRRQNTAAGLAASLREMGVGVQPPLHEQLSDLRIPTLVAVGEHDAKFRTIGGMLARSIPESVFRIIPDAGHAPHWERPATIARLVAAFLQHKKVPELCSDPALSQ